MDRNTVRDLMARLNGDAERIAACFALRYRTIEAERANVKSRYGHCTDDGLIKIRLRHATTGRPLKYSSLVNTLCHELAHLRHFNHGPRFKAFYFQLLDYARAEGIYRPGLVGSRQGRAPEAIPERPRRKRNEVGGAAEPRGPIQLALL